jgi:CheY-like chemotaxis protein
MYSPLKLYLRFEWKGGRMSTVLIVENDSSTRELLRALFDPASGFDTCLEAGDGVQAVDMTLQLLPNLVVLGFSLSGTTGLQLARRLKTITPQLPIFMLTEDYTASLEKDALTCGITAVFSKLDDLAPVVANARAVCGIDS